MDFNTTECRRFRTASGADPMGIGCPQQAADYDEGSCPLDVWGLVGETTAVNAETFQALNDLMQALGLEENQQQQQGGSSGSGGAAPSGGC